MQNFDRLTCVTGSLVEYVTPDVYRLCKQTFRIRPIKMQAISSMDFSKYIQESPQHLPVPPVTAVSQ
jgi:hypothetical protein